MILQLALQGDSPRTSTSVSAELVPNKPRFCLNIQETMSEIQNTFKYEPFTQPDSIRLLALQPSPPGRTIRGSLVHTTLAECHYDIHFPYTALSYVWGDPKRTAKIIIDNQPFTVTANLASVLDNLRDEKVAIRVWADAVCMDQSNIPERNQQVGLMRDVYYFARQTIVYLGEADGPSREVFDVLRKWRPASEELIVSTAIHESAAIHILSRPWFFRVWIYQELVLSRGVWVQLGRDRMLWYDFCLALLGPNGKDGDAERALESPLSDLVMLSKMREARHSFRKSQLIEAEKPASLFSVLEARRGFQVTDLRDMVYGYLAVAGLHPRSKVTSSKSHDSRFLIDYNKTVADVFTDAASYIVETGLGPGILSKVELLNENRRMKMLPSWVPDWSQRVGRTTLQIPGPPGSPPLDSSYNPFLVISSVFVCKGQFFSSIKETGEESSFFVGIWRL